MENLNVKSFSTKMEEKQFGFYKLMDEEVAVVQASPSEYNFCEFLEDSALSTKTTYECLGKGFVRKTTTIISTPDVDDVITELTAPPSVTGTYYVYAQKAGHLDVARAEVYVKKYPVSKFDFFVDEADVTEKLDQLLRIVGKGDAVVVGSITDFMCDGSVNSMLNVLERLDSRGVIILSRLEPDYDISTYRPMLNLAERIAGAIADGKTI